MNDVLPAPSLESADAGQPAACPSPSRSATACCVNRIVNGVARVRLPRIGLPAALAEVRRFLRRAAEARARRGRGIRRAAAADLRGRLRMPCRRWRGSRTTTDLAHLAQELPEQADLLESDDDAPIIRLINAVLTQAVKRERLRHPRRAVREPAGDALPRRWRAARSAAVQARRGAAGGVAHQGHVAARHRREAPAAGRSHQPAHRRARGRRARLDHSVRPRRARGAAYPRQAGRAARARIAWAWMRAPRR